VKEYSLDYLWLAVISETSDDLRKLHKFSVFHGYSVRGHEHMRLRKNLSFCPFPSPDSGVTA
jgi:hypothetical protein